MSIFSKLVRDLNFNDIEELEIQRMSENIRLEFKEQAPNKDETIKKLSSLQIHMGDMLLLGYATMGRVIWLL